MDHRWLSCHTLGIDGAPVTLVTLTKNVSLRLVQCVSLTSTVNGIGAASRRDRLRRRRLCHIVDARNRGTVRRRDIEGDATVGAGADRLTVNVKFVVGICCLRRQLRHDRKIRRCRYDQQ